MTLQDICKEKTQALNMTYPQIADETGIPLQTIRNFFSSSSKAVHQYRRANLQGAGDLAG